MEQLISDPQSQRYKTGRCQTADTPARHYKQLFISPILTTSSVSLLCLPFSYTRIKLTNTCTWIYECNVITQFVCFWRDSPQWARASSFMRFLDHTQRRTTVGRTPLDEWSARRRDLYLTTLTTDRYPCPGGTRTHNLSSRAAADLRLRPRGHWDRLITQ